MISVQEDLNLNKSVESNLNVSYHIHDIKSITLIKSVKIQFRVKQDPEEAKT